MIEKNIYRLGEYQITEYEDGALWWNTHRGFAEQRSGICFIYQDILIIGEFINKEDGFLKREFLQRLKKFPVWDKTKFYCFLSELLDVSSGTSLSQSRGGRIPAILRLKVAEAQHVEGEGSGTFRLDKYIITVAGTKKISWRALESMDRVVGGPCIIHSGILFIGPKDYEARRTNGQESFNEHREMPKWKGTAIWSHGLALRPCESSPQTGQLYDIGEKVKWRGRRYSEKRIATLWKKSREEFKPKFLLAPGKARIFLTPRLLVRRVVGPMVMLWVRSANHVPIASLKAIIANRTAWKGLYKRIMEPFRRLKKHMILALILILQVDGTFHITLTNGAMGAILL